MAPMPNHLLLPADLTTEALLRLVPGARELAGVTIPDSPDAAYPTPFGDHPPIEWFLEPHPEVVAGASGIITAEGRFCAFSHEWDRCHNSWTDSGECWMPPRSVTGGRYFHQSAVAARAGDDTLIQIPCGVIPLWGGHADIDADIFEAMRHYDRPERVRVRCRAIETDAGTIMCGSIVPGTTYREVGVMRAAALSGDWRWVPELGAQEFIGPCFVARPGLPLGLEQAAIDAAFWDIARDLLVSESMVTTASGLVVPASVATVPVLWTPRPTITSNLSSTVIAAAQGATTAMSKKTITIEVPEGVAPDVFERAMSVVAAAAVAPPVQGEVHSCTCNATASGGDPKEQAIKSHPAPRGELLYGAAVTADGEVDGTAFAELSGVVESLAETVAALAEDVATMVGRSLEPADMVEEMPQPPELS